MHTRQQHPLQPLLGFHGIHAERLGAGECLRLRRLALPQFTFFQGVFDSQQGLPKLHIFTHTGVSNRLTVGRQRITLMPRGGILRNTFAPRCRRNKKMGVLIAQYPRFVL
ncbi:hypothetical protein AU509_04480 [Lonsdalea britannica]|nr:hypothetical protein AU509_04480 [Lonsdalea britannica]